MELGNPARKALVHTMRTDAPEIVALIPVASIYGERVPAERTNPFIKTGNPSATPFRLACHDGEQVDISISAFVSGDDNGPASAVGEAIKDRFRDGVLELESGEKVSIVWRSGFVLPDPEEADLWHAFNNFTVA